MTLFLMTSVLKGNKIKITNPFLDKEMYYGVDKKEAVESYQKKGYKVIFVGDGPSDYRGDGNS